MEEEEEEEEEEGGRVGVEVGRRVPECLTKLLVLCEGLSLHLVTEDTGIDEYPDGVFFGEVEDGGGKHCVWVGGGIE